MRRHRSRRKTVRRWIIASACLAAAIGLAAVVYGTSSPRVVVRVINETDHTLVDVNLTCGGGENSAEVLVPGDQVAWRVRPGDGGSPVVLSFDEGDERRVVACKARLDGGRRGALYLFVGPDGVRESDRTRP